MPQISHICNIDSPFSANENSEPLSSAASAQCFNCALEFSYVCRPNWRLKALALTGYCYFK